MDALSPVEVEWLIQSKVEKDKQHYEMIAHAVQVGYLRTQSKKKIEMFESNAPKIGRITREKRERDLAHLRKTFNTPQ